MSTKPLLELGKSSRDISMEKKLDDDYSPKYIAIISLFAIIEYFIHNLYVMLFALVILSFLNNPNSLKSIGESVKSYINYGLYLVITLISDIKPLNDVFTIASLIIFVLILYAFEKQFHTSSSYINISAPVGSFNAFDNWT